METTEKDRKEWAAWAAWRLLPVPRPPGNTHLLITEDGRGSDEAMLALCRDVDALETALRETLMGLEALIEVAGPPRNNATAIHGYEDALRRAAKARAVLGLS